MSGQPPEFEDPRDVERGRRLNELFSRRVRAGGAAEAVAGQEVPPTFAAAGVSGDVRECLGVLDALHGATATVDTLVAQGVLRKSDDPRYAAELGPYKIDRFIGRGGMGLVFKAYEPALDRTIALKLLRPELAVDTAALARFEREARAAAALRHPNIVAVYAVGRSGRLPYIAMEYVDGPSLAEVVRAVSSQLSAISQTAHDGESGQSEPEARARAHADASASLRRSVAPSLTTDAIRRIFRELLAGLDAAHKAGLIHRDIKAANILLDLASSEGLRDSGIKGLREGGGSPAAAEVRITPLNLSVPQSLNPFVKIADFGLARMLSSQTQMTLDGSVLGTPEYMSPEQARGEEVDLRTDLYSAGVVLYEMLTGRTPFKADTTTATIRRILDEDPPDPRKLDKGVDPVLASLALRLLAKRREERLGTAGEAIAALEASKCLRTVVRRHRFQWVIPASVVVLTLVPAAVWLAGHFGSTRIRQPSEAIRLPIEPGSQPARRITKVALDKDKATHVAMSILVYFDDDAQPKRPSWLDDLHYHGEVLDAKVADPNGDGQKIVVVGLNQPLNSDGEVLVAFDTEGTKLWGCSLTPVEPNEPSKWPNCRPGLDWCLSHFIVGNLEHEAGDDIIAIASYRGEYPTRVSRIDPHDGHIRATFWHFGNIGGYDDADAGVQIIPDFAFESADPQAGHVLRPAILAYGVNNKLDGFYDDALSKDDGPLQVLSGDDAPRTCWNWVPVAMILDPERMDGRGPPRTARMDRYGLPAATPYAYAYIDAAANPREGLWNSAARKRDRAAQADTAVIVDLQYFRPPDASNGAWSMLAHVSRLQENDWEARAPDTPAKGSDTSFLLNNELQVMAVGVGSVPALTRDQADEWRGRWHPIIQRYRYVTQGATATGCGDKAERVGADTGE